MYKPTVSDLLKFGSAEGTESQQNCQNEQQSLDIQHYCTCIGGKVSVLWELKPVEPTQSPRLLFYEVKRPPPPEPRMPSRLMCVIDVSHSMGEPLTSPREDETDVILSKLDRIRLFAQLLVRTIDAEDCLGFVTFGTHARVVCQLQKMTSGAKESALQAIDNISLGGVRNLSAGLFAAVEQFRADFKRSRFFDDSILLFSDGMANDGVTDVDELLEEIKSRIDCVRQECIYEPDYSIRIVTLGTGGFLPEMLLRLGHEFSSDAFQRLDSTAPMELGLMKPLLLRQTCVLSHAQVTIQTLNGVQLDRLRMNEGLSYVTRSVDVEGDNTKVVYYIHDIGAGLQRHLNCVLLISPKCKKILKKKNLDVVEITVRYLDAKLTARTVTRVINFEALVLKDKDNNLARDVIASAKNDTRVIAWRALYESSQCMKMLDRAGAHRCLTNACESIRSIGVLLEEKLHVTEEAQESWLAYAEPIIFNLEHYNGLVTDLTLIWDDIWSRLIALATSLARESPAAAGVYANGVDLFSSLTLDEKMHDMCYDIKSIYVAMGIPSEAIDDYQHALVKVADNNDLQQNNDIVLYS